MGLISMLLFLCNLDGAVFFFNPRVQLFGFTFRLQTLLRSLCDDELGEGIIISALQYLVKGESYYYYCLRKYCANDFFFCR
jgi:hypothetical protein